MTTSQAAAGGSVSMLRRLGRQVSFDLLVFRRNPAATFFTIILPLVFLLLFTSIFGNETLDNGAKVATFYVPGIMALALVSATAVNLAIGMTARRERGVLKRVRGTPIPPWIFVAAQGVAGFAISLLMTVIIVIVGRVLFGVSLNLAGVPSLIITVAIAAASFAMIGLALTTIIASEDASPAVTNAIMLPLYFISDVFIPEGQVPGWVETVGNIFPVRHLNQALQDSFDPFFEGTPWPWGHWLVIAVWGMGAAAVTLRWFRWTPRR